MHRRRHYSRAGFELYCRPAARRRADRRCASGCRKAPGEFPENTVDLLRLLVHSLYWRFKTRGSLKTFSPYARTDEVVGALACRQVRLVQTEKLASLGQLTVGIAHEIKNPLNFVNDFSALAMGLVEKRTRCLRGLRSTGKYAAKLAELAQTLEEQLRKVAPARQARRRHCENHAAHCRERRSMATRSRCRSDEWYMAARREGGLQHRLPARRRRGMADVLPQRCTRALPRVA